MKEGNKNKISNIKNCSIRINHKIETCEARKHRRIIRRNEKTIGRQEERTGRQKGGSDSNKT